MVTATAVSVLLTPLKQTLAKRNAAG